MKVEISINSYSEEIKLNCPVCTETVKAEIWLIIDVIERMDLAARILEGSLNSIKCTKCSNEGLFDTPLLLLKSDQHPPLIFSQSSQATEEESRDEAFHLMSILKNRMGKKWNDEWFSNVCSIKSQFLPTVLSEWLNRGISKKSDKQPAPETKSSLELQIIFEELAESANQSDMEYRTKLCHQALSLVDRRETPELWALLQCELGTSLAQNISVNMVENIELSIEAYKRALKVFTKESTPSEWAAVMMNLGAAYARRIKQDRAESLELSVEACTKALEIYTKEAAPIDWATIMMNLGGTYFHRTRENKGENLELSIETCKKALEVFTKDTTPIQWAMTMNNLAIAYRDRLREDKAENLELSIEVCKQALEVRTRELTPVDWAMTMMNLGSAYLHRIKQDRGENLELSIETCKKALEVFTKDTTPIQWAMTMNNLANAYQVRLREDREENLELSIEAYKQALEVRTKELMPVDWAITMMNLANAYLCRSRIKKDRGENLELSIEAYKQALKVFTKDTTPALWAMTMMNLGNAYLYQIKEDNTENIELSIEACKQALEIRTRVATPVQWAMTMMNLGVAYHIRQMKDGKIEHMEQSIKYYKCSLEILSPNSLPNDCRRAATGLATLYFQQNNWHDAVIIYNQAIEAAENLYRSSIFRYSKEAELTENRDLYHLAAYSFARIGDLRKAVIILERAKARRLSEVLERERTDLEQIQKEHPNAHKSYQDAVINLRQLENEELRGYTISPEHKRHLTPEDLRQWASKAKTDLDAAIEEINAIPGYEKFLAQADFDDIENAIEPDCPLVYLVTTPAGSLSLIISKSCRQEDSENISIEPIWSDSFAQSSLTEVLDNWFGAYEKIKKVDKETPKEKEAQRFWLETIEKTTKTLWKGLMGEVTQHLLGIKAQQAVLIPMGSLALLPLHSAWTELDGKRHYALDDVAFTYAPSAVALSHSRQIAEKVSSQQLFAVVEPKPVTADDLPNANIEADAVASLFNSAQMFKHEDATRVAVLEKLPEADIVHFSCHGATNLQEPLKSGLLMAENEMITAGDLFQLGLKGARMATLSACETGIVGVNLPDEAIALPAAFLQAGFAGVVASLWLVDDLSTAMLMERFYQLWRSEGIPPAQALQKAQQWLRDTTNKEKADYFGKDLFSIFSASAVRMSGVTATEFYDRLSYDLTDEYKFEHPFYWAAFSLTGV